MDIKDMTDDEAIMLVQEKDEYAKDLLFKKYSYIIDIVLKKYDKAIKMCNIDRKEIYSEALYGFSDSLISYDSNKEASLPTFITLCVDRRINKYVKSAMGPKNQFALNTYSLDYVYDEYGFSLVDILSDNNKNNPLDNMESDESMRELYNNIKGILSDQEKNVFEYMLQGFNYVDIAHILDKEPKQIDNTMQRIKNKVKKLLES